jgi:hypothetical protein
MREKTYKHIRTTKEGVPEQNQILEEINTNRLFNWKIDALLHKYKGTFTVIFRLCKRIEYNLTSHRHSTDIHSEVSGKT